jgi:crotonobetainyl-CoA:carnitine CoA-transferase CaiB-like acyl-CoA transferase
VNQPMLPLNGLRVIAIEQYGAGPFGSLHLADLGADVIKIEDPSIGGDVGRYTPPFAEGGDSIFYQSLNRNKRSILLDIRNDAGRGVFERLVEKCDAVFSNLRGDGPSKLRITYDDLKDINPRIVCCSLSGFGMTGPRSNQPGYDYILQAMSGWMSLTGELNDPPTKTGVSLVDFSGGVNAALALVSGVLGARSTGQGMDCDVSLYDTSIAMLNYLAAWHLTTGFEPKRTSHSAHPSLVPFQNFETTDSWIVIACPKEKFWRLFVSAMGDPDWGSDSRFASVDLRYENSHLLIPLIEKEILLRTSHEWIELFESYGVPCAAVSTVPMALRDPHTLARKLVVEVEHPVWGIVREVATASRAGEQREHHTRAPELGEHNESVLTELCGYDEVERRALELAGAFGPGGY